MSDPAETAFCELKSETLELWRGGWPDYFARHRHTDQVVGIEVKRGNGKISPSQARMFEALEKAKLSIFVWHPQTPRYLIPWRNYQRKVVDVTSCLELEVLDCVDISKDQRHKFNKFRLAQIREHQGMNQQELARRAKLSQSEVSRIEKRDDCLVSTIRRYLAALGGELLIHIEIDGQQYPVTL